MQATQSAAVADGSRGVTDMSFHCRVCLQAPEKAQLLDLTTIYDEEDQLTYCDCFRICTQIELREEGHNALGLPQNLCKSCGLELQMAYDFYKKVEDSKRSLRQLHEQHEKEQEELERRLEAEPEEEENLAMTKHRTMLSSQESIVKEEPMVLDEMVECDVMEEHLDMEEFHTMEEVNDDALSARVAKAMEPMFLRLSSDVEALRREVKELRKAEKCDSSKNKIMPNFPFAIMEDFLAFEKVLRENKEALDTFQNELKFLSVNPNFVTNCWRKVFKDNLAERFSWQGTEDKKSVRNLSTAIAIRNAETIQIKINLNENSADSEEEYTIEAIPLDEQQMYTYSESESGGQIDNNDEEAGKVYDDEEEVASSEMFWQQAVVTVANESHLPLKIGDDDEEDEEDEEEGEEEQPIITKIVTQSQSRAEIEESECQATSTAKANRIETAERKRYTGKYSCDFCAKEFPNYSRMSVHRRMHESDRPKWSCGDCGRLYATKQAMDVHIRSVHTKTGGHICPICQKVYAIKKGLEIHMRYHNGDFPFVCDLCGKKFAQMSHLNTHKNVKHNSVRFCCEHPSCGKFFTSSASLRNHEFTHGQMPFECEFCHRGYPAKSKLKVHIKLKHDQIMTLDQLEHMRKFHVKRSKLNMVKVLECED